MPIIESRIDKIEPQRPGRIRVHEFFRDHTGFETTNIYDVPDSYDTAQHLVDAVVARDAQAIEAEAENVQQRSLDSEDPATFPRDHITIGRFRSAVVSAVLNGRAQRIKPAADWVDGLTNAQLNAAVGADRRVRVRNRVASIQGLEIDLTADEALREELETA